MEVSNTLARKKNVNDPSITIFFKKFSQERKKKRSREVEQRALDAVTIFFQHFSKDFFQGKRKRRIIEQRSGTINSRSSKSLDRKLVTSVSEKGRHKRAKNFKNQITVFRNRFCPIRDYRFYSPFATISSVISSHGSHKSQREYYPLLALRGENHR